MFFPRTKTAALPLAATVLFAAACGERGLSVPSEPLMAPKATASFDVSPVTTVWDFVALAGVPGGPQGQTKTFTVSGAGDIDASAGPVGAAPSGLTVFPQVYSKGITLPAGNEERGLGLCLSAPTVADFCLGASDNEIGDPWTHITPLYAGYDPSLFLDFTGLVAGSVVKSVTLTSLQPGEGWLVYSSTDGVNYTTVVSQGIADGSQQPSLVIPLLPGTKFLKFSTNPMGGEGNNYLVQSVTVVMTPPNLGNQGCTPGYWKQSQHFDSWTATGYTTGQAISTVFNVPASLKLNGAGLGTSSLLNGLSFKGGSDASGKAQILLRAAVAGLLNTGGVQYGMTKTDLINSVNAALASGDGTQMTNIGTQIDKLNNGKAGCPLN